MVFWGGLPYHGFQHNPTGLSWDSWWLIIGPSVRDRKPAQGAPSVLFWTRRAVLGS